MMFSGVEILKLQFSRAIDQTFEQFLDSWTLPLPQEEARAEGFGVPAEFATEIPVIRPN